MSFLSQINKISILYQLFRVESLKVEQKLHFVKKNVGLHIWDHMVYKA